MSTFETLESFEDGDIAEYSGDTDGYFAVRNKNNTSPTYLTSVDGDYYLQWDFAGREVIYNNAIPTEQGFTYRFSQFTDSAYDCDVLFGVQDADNFYYTRMYTADDIRIGKVVGGTDTELASFTDNGALTQFRELEWADDGTITVRCYESPSYDNVALSGSAEISATDTTFMSGGLGFGADTTYPTTSIREWDYVQKKVPPVVVDETASTQSTAFSPSATTETGAGTDATPTQTSTFTEREGAETAVTTDSVSVQTTAVSPVQGEVVGVAADATVAESITLSPAVTVEAPVGSDTAATTAAQFTPGQTTDSATTTQDTLKTTLTYMPSFGDVRPIAGAVAQTVPLDVSPQAGADTATTDLPAEPTPAAFIPTVTADAGITGLSSPTQSVVLMTPDGDVEGVVDASASAQSFPVGVVGGAETGLATDHTTSTPWAVTIPPGVEFIPRWSMLGTNYAVLHSNGANSLVLHD